jgi:hypothetical protein
MEWLGIHIPEDIKEELKACPNAALRSRQLGTEIAKDLIQYCLERSIPFGFNVESVATRREEVEASLELLSSIGGMLTTIGLRKRSNNNVVHELARKETLL